MLDERDLQAIAALIDAKLDAKLAAQEARLDAKMDAKLAAQEARLDAKMDAKLAAQEARLDAKLAAQEERLTAKIEQAQREAVEQSRQNMLLWYENRVEPQLRLLAEGHAAILEKLEPRIEDAEQRLDKLETEVLILKSSIG